MTGPWVRRLANGGVKALLYLVARGRTAPGIPVLTYHSVDDSGSWLSVSPDELAGHLGFLRKEGWRGLRAAELAERLASGTSGMSGMSGRRELLITFDDGYANFHQEAAPVLARFGYPATVFVVTDFMGDRPRWFERDRQAIHRFLASLPITGVERARLGRMMDGALGTRLMTWAEARELAAAGFDIESHGAGHHFLTALSDRALRDDLERSRHALASELGSAPRLFCYPYGDADARVAAATREAGYAGAVLSAWRRWGDPFRIGRVGVYARTSRFELRFALSQAVAYHAALKSA